MDFKKFEEAVDKRMQQDGFILYRRGFEPNRDGMALLYCKMNVPTYAMVSISGLELMEAVDVTLLAEARAESAIKNYYRRSRQT